MSGAGLSEAMLSVGRFHEAFGLPVASLPNVDIPADLAKLRVDLLREEVGEFADATADRNIVGIADALADIIYVAYGAAITYGIDLDAVLREVHRSNMSKLDEHGRPCYRADGKVLKSARYSPPDVSKVLLLSRLFRSDGRCRLCRSGNVQRLYRCRYDATREGVRHLCRGRRVPAGSGLDLEARSQPDGNTLVSASQASRSVLSRPSEASCTTRHVPSEQVHLEDDLGYLQI